MAKFNHNIGHIKGIYATKGGFYPRNWEIHISHHLLDIRNPFLKIQILYENANLDLYYFHVAIETSYHKLGGIKQQKYLLTALETRNLKSVLLVHKQDIGRVALPPEALGENLLLASFKNVITTAKTSFTDKVTFTGSIY